MLANQKLHDRINKEGNAHAFERLRLWLYWSLVQQLSNICSDTDDRSPSIARVTEKLKKISYGSNCKKSALRTIGYSEKRRFEPISTEPIQITCDVPMKCCPRGRSVATRKFATSLFRITTHVSTLKRRTC